MASVNESARPSVPALALFTCWLASGALLEGLHAIKARPYLEDSLRREMWTLAHAHGALLALALFAISGILRVHLGRNALGLIAERLFATGAMLTPLGFLLGGAWHFESDPGLGILLVPVGVACCVSGLIAWIVACRREATGRTAS